MSSVKMNVRPSKYLLVVPLQKKEITSHTVVIHVPNSEIKLFSHYQKKLYMPRKRTKSDSSFFSPNKCFQTFQSILMLFTNCLFQGPTELLTNVFTIKHQTKVPVLTYLNGFQICVEFQEPLCLTMTLGLLQCEHSKYSLSKHTELPHQQAS